MATTMRGKTLDMASLAAANSHKTALGNAGMNARGDQISADGSVLRLHEDMTREYNQSNPKAVKQLGINRLNADVFASAAEAVAQTRKTVQSQKAGVEAKSQSKRRIADSD